MHAPSPTTRQSSTPACCAELARGDLLDHASISCAVRPAARTAATAAPGPVEHPQGPQRVPAARLALALVHVEMRLALVHPLERPSAVGPTVPLDDVDRLADARIGFGRGRAQVVQATQHVVVVPGREGEPEPVVVDHLARRLATEQAPLQQVLLPAEAGGPDLGRIAHRPLELQQAFEDPDRGPERRHRRAVLGLAVPAAVGELLPEQPVHQGADVLAEVGADRDDDPVDARLDLAGEERVAGPLVRRVPALPRDMVPHELGRPPGLRRSRGRDPAAAAARACASCPSSRATTRGRPTGRRRPAARAAARPSPRSRPSPAPPRRRPRVRA